MSNKQQALVNTLVKFIRQYFIFEEDPPQQDAVVRLRNSTRCVVQADEEKERAEKNKRRSVQKVVQRCRGKKLICRHFTFVSFFLNL